MTQIEKIEDDYRKKELDLLNDLDISQDKNEASISLTRELLTVHGPWGFFLIQQLVWILSDKLLYGW